MNDKEAIDAYVDGGLGMASAAISLIHPTLSIAALAVQPVLSNQLKKFLYHLAGINQITQRECSRLEQGIDGMTETLQENMSNSKLRTDSLLRPNSNGFCDADDIFEDLINSIKQDSENKKAKFCGNFIGNIPYSTDLNYSNLMQYSKVISQLTYTELCLLNNFYKNYKDKSVDFGKAEIYVKRTEDPDASELLVEITHMRNIGLLNSHPPYNQGEIIGKVSLSFYGERLFTLMRLNLLDRKDTNRTLGEVWRVTKYLSL